MIEKTWVVGPFQCNCRLIACPETGEAALVDPGDEAARILRDLRGMEVAPGVPLQLRWLLHTHGHLDHISATRSIRESFSSAAPNSSGPRIALHRGDEEIYKALPMQGQLFGLQYGEPLPVDHFLEHEEEIRIGALRLSVIHTPGHSPGSVCLRLHESSATRTSETVFSGDTLFAGSVGRTDLWGADGDAMFRNIRTRLLTLDGDTRVCPGHGPDTRMGIEKRENPFLI